MRRRRFQKGSLQKVWNGSTYVWQLKYYDGTGSRRTLTLGPCSQHSKSVAEVWRVEVLQPLNAGATTTLPVIVGAYVEDVFLPHKRRGWKKSTRRTAEQTIQQYILPAFGHRLVSQLKREELQAFLESKAATLSRSIVGHLRWFLQDILELANSDGIVRNNQAAELDIPKQCKPSGRRFLPLTEDQVNLYLSVLEQRERLIARLGIYEGMRPGEIYALRWKSFDGECLRIEQRVYEGVFDTPKNGKVRDAAASDGTIAELIAWRELAVDPRPEAWVFPSEKMTTPLSHQNVWKGWFKPKLEPLGLGWATFQVLRQTNSTLMQKYDVDPKVGADQRGHGLGVSMEVYTKSDREQKRQAVRTIESAVAARKQREKLSA